MNTVTRLLTALGALVLSSLPAAARPAADYLPAGLSYDPAVPTPRAVLGFEVGERHARPDQIVRYMRRLAATSDRVRLEIEGRTHEGRPQVLLTVSSPANLERLEEIRRRHLASSDGDAGPLAEGMPVVVWLGYSIHGNEASGANASLLVAYYLAAAQGPEVEALLDGSVILLDPSLNPDGLARYTQWVEENRSRIPVADPAHREHREPWPRGRTNHYWFDLNRDWLPLQQPESRARVATFQRWRPNVFADYHEMGSESTYFFQPGVPSRQNPLTPPRNLELTRELARYHAAALDRAGRLYFTEEVFDDFYYGKGSTYPDIQGGIGILFEQASSRGLVRDTPDGPLAFADAVADQLATSLSTLQGSFDDRRDLLAYQAEFYREALAEARRDPVRAYVFAAPDDPVRGWELRRLLAAQGVEVHSLARPVEAAGLSFAPGSSWIVPLEQRQARLVEAVFERRTTFPDHIFYDISTWTLPLAFGLPYAPLDRKGFAASLLGPIVDGAEPPRGAMGAAAPPPYAWAFEWSGYFAPRALYRLLAAGVRARVATRPFGAETGRGHHSFDRGTVVVPLGVQDTDTGRIAELLAQAAREDAVDVYALGSGLTPEGIDLGSPSLRPLTEPKPALVVGEGVSAYEAGEIWHLLDFRFGIPLSLVDLAALPQLDLGHYTHLLLVDGTYDAIPEETVEAIRRWLHAGGTLVASRRAAGWAGEKLLGREGTQAPAAPPAPTTGTVSQRPYAEFEANRAEEQISGAIFQMRLDTTHPLGFGYRDPLVPVFRTDSRVLEASPDPYENVALYTDSPLLSGYAAPDRIDRLAGTGALVVHRLGRGTLVRIADDLDFRAFWYGTAKLYMNTLFFAPVVKPTSPPASWE